MVLQMPYFDKIRVPGVFGDPQIIVALFLVYRQTALPATNINLSHLSGWSAEDMPCVTHVTLAVATDLRVTHDTSRLERIGLTFVLMQCSITAVEEAVAA